MGVLVYVLGRSGTGKSYSMRNFDKNKLGVVNVQGKILPFKGAGAIETVNTDQSDEIVRAIDKLAKSHKSIVVDDYQYVMANEFMRRAAERGYDKFTEIARHAWDIADCVRKLPSDVIVYIMCHTDTDNEGTERLKTIGRLLDEKICLEGMSTIVLKTNVSDGQYTFLTQNNGKDTVKSPAGMFPSYAIDNDLNYVDEKIRNYYELGEFLTDKEIAEIDEAAKKVDIQIDSGEKKRRARKNTTTEEKPAATEEVKASETSTEEAPKRKTRKKVDEEPVEETQSEELPKRKARNTAVVTETPLKSLSNLDEIIDDGEPEKKETTDAEPVRRRRRRVE